MMDGVKRWRVSTTALCTVSVTVEAPTAEDAIAAVPRGGHLWRIGGVFGDVDVSDGEVEAELVTEAHPVDLVEAGET